MTFLLSVALMLVAVLAVVSSRRLTGDYFTPAAVVASTWCGALSLYVLHLLRYPPVRASTVAFILAAIALMVVGSWIGMRLSHRLRLGRRGPASPVPLHADVWVLGFCLLALAGVAQYIDAVGTTIGLDAFLVEPARIRSGIGSRAIPSGFLFLTYFCIVAPVTAVALSLGGVGLRRRTWLAVGVVTLSTWITTDRTTFFTVTLIVYFMYVFRRGSRLSWPGLVGVTGIAAFALVANFLIVGAWLGKTPANLGVRMVVPSVTTEAPDTAGGTTSPAGEPGNQPGAQTLPGRIGSLVQRGLQASSTIYLYATGSFAALDSLLRDPLPRTYGLHSIYPVVRALDRAGLIEITLPAAIAPFRPLQVSADRSVMFNTYTYLYYPLTDFGPVGALGYAAVIGVFAGLVYGLVDRQRSHPAALLLVGQVSLALLLSIFVNKFNNTGSWYILAFSLLPFVVARIGLVQSQPVTAGGPDGSRISGADRS